MTPEQTIAFLNGYYARIVPLIHDHGGTVISIAAVVLWRKELASEANWISEPMLLASDGQFVASVPAPRDGLLFMVEIRTTENSAAQFPSVLKATPYWVTEGRPKAIAK